MMLSLIRASSRILLIEASCFFFFVAVDQMPYVGEKRGAFDAIN